MNSANPVDCAAVPFPGVSGVPIVSWVDDLTGGLHDGNASGAPCVKPAGDGPVHWLNASSSETRSGEAPLGRG